MIGPDGFCDKCQQPEPLCECGHEARAVFVALDGPLTSSELLAEARGTYQRWLGRDYDLGVLDVVLCTAAAEQLTGDPPWLLIVGGSGAAKTETITPLQSAGAIVVSTISGESGLLSGTPAKDRAADATGGLLREIGDAGLLVIKDFTSILSMNKDTRALVLGALREIHDGHWSRRIGGEGGRILPWSGRLVIIGACTTAWDAAHLVIATMGDRFLLVRPRTVPGSRRAAGLQAMRNVSSETEMREQLGQAVAALLGSVAGRGPVLTDDENEAVLDLADLIARTRTAVQRTFSGEPAFAHATEMPTRIAKQLAQLLRGGLALGMNRDEAMRVVERCAADTMPPMRLRLLVDVAANPGSPTARVTSRVQLPNKTVDRALQELHLLGLLTVDEIDYGSKTRWIYTLASDVSGEALERLRRVSQVGTDFSDKGAPDAPESLSEMSVPAYRAVAALAAGGLNGDVISHDAEPADSPSQPRKQGVRLSAAENATVTRRAFQMFDQGVSGREAARRLGISEPTARAYRNKWKAGRPS
jgi:Homeodomain-like domain